MSLIIDNLSFSYGKNEIFANYNMELQNGINVILGANGSGKTTLFKILATIFEPKKGAIILNSLDYKSKEYRKHIAYIPQNFDIYPNLKVNEFLEYVAQIKYNYSHKQIVNEIDRISAATDIIDFLDKKMKDLSEGMRKRVGIAQALIGDADLIIADEPTAGLDPEQRNKFNIVLKKIMTNKIFLISTHIIEDIKEYYDHIITLSNGNISFSGNYRQLMNSLDNSVVEMTIQLSDLEEYEKKYKIIYKNFNEEIVTIRAVVDNIEDNMKIITPTITEIWTYYK